MRCYYCGFYDSDYEQCTCPSFEKWYACPLESEKPENKKEMEEYLKLFDERSEENEREGI